MAEILALTCPECDKTLKVPAEMAGKKVRCKFCKATFVAKGGKAPAKAAPAKGAPAKAVPAKGKPKKDEEDEVIPVQEEKKPSLDDEEDSNPYGMTEEYLGPRCPECANEMEEGDIICLHCGYNVRTRERARTKKVVDITGMDYFLWWLPGIACVLAIILLITFDIVYCLKIEDWVDYGKDTAPWYSFIGHFAIKLWLVIFTLFLMFFAGRYAVKRLILDNQPPEIEKH
jgi:ribosomal protein S27E